MIEINSKIEWEKKYSQADAASGKFLQSWEWGEFQSSLGRKIIRFADGGALAQIIELPLPLGKKYWFSPKGPIMDNGQWTMDNLFVAELANKSQEAGAIFLRIEPPPFVIASESKRARQSRDINPRATSIIDLTKSEEELLAGMHQKTRYNIRVAEKHEVAAGQWTMDNGQIFEKVFELFQETAKRDGFRLHPRAYYEKQIQMSNVEVFGAEYDGKLLAAAVVIFEADTATYLHGASSNEMRNVMAPHALHWAIMKSAKERGCARYDMWGVSDDTKSGWAGITRFKRGFGGNDVSAPGTFDLPVNDFWYSVYRLVRRMRP